MDPRPECFEQPLTTYLTLNDSGRIPAPELLTESRARINLLGLPIAYLKENNPARTLLTGGKDSDEMVTLAELESACCLQDRKSVV